MTPVKIKTDVVLHIRKEDDFVEFYLKIFDLEIPITKIQAEKIIGQTLPPEKLVYSINTTDGESSFYSKEYPEWSIKSHSAELVAGNIYYSSKERAQEVLVNTLKLYIRKMDDLHKKEQNVLCKKLKSLAKERND
jgi:hypothetical protein